jgi:hypothetical protein
MNILDKIDKMIGEKQVQGFSNTKELGKEIEHMDTYVENMDRKKFDKILSKYLDKVDPKNDLSISQAVMKLGMKKGLQMYNELSDLHYRG